MGLFGNDKEQDTRLESLEIHVREITDTLINSCLEVAALRVSQINLQAQVEGKVTAGEVDPAITALNEQLGVARVETEKAANAAAESWGSLHTKAAAALKSLQANIAKAAAERDQN